MKQIIKQPQQRCRGIKIKKTALNNAREQLAGKKAALEEEINRELDA